MKKDIIRKGLKGEYVTIWVQVFPQAQARAQWCYRRNKERLEMSEQWKERDKQIPLAWSHEKPLLPCALCAPLGCSTLVCKSPKPSQNSQIHKYLHSNSMNSATPFRDFSRQLKSPIYILLEPPQRLLSPSEFTLKQKFFYPPGMGTKNNLFSVSTSVTYFPSSFCPFPSPLSPALLLKGESNRDIWDYKGFWMSEPGVSKALRKEFKGSQWHAVMLYKHILNGTIIRPALAPQLH